MYLRLHDINSTLITFMTAIIGENKATLREEGDSVIPYTDTHCHLDFDRFDKDRDQVIKRAWNAGLVWILNPGIDLQTNQAAIELARAFPDNISAAVGIHPNFGQPWTADILPALRDQAHQPGVVAIGEIGLDYYRQHTPFDQQRVMFIAQLTLAQELALPVILHNRDATQDLLEIIKDWQQGLIATSHPLADRPGVLHSFSADYDSALTALELNFCIGISGPVTFTNASERKKIVGQLPLERLLLETDAPFLAPHPHRGKRNEPSFIPLIAEEIARLHGTSPKQAAEITYANACRLFNLTTEF
jgi:TatD DNase family protein